MTAVAVQRLHSLFLKGAQSLLWLGRRQTDRYALSGVPDLSRQDKHVPDTHPYDRPLRGSWLIRRGGAQAGGGAVTQAESQHVISTVGPPPGLPGPLLRGVWPGPRASELKPDSSGFQRTPFEPTLLYFSAGDEITSSPSQAKCPIGSLPAHCLTAQGEGRNDGPCLDGHRAV